MKANPPSLFQAGRFPVTLLEARDMGVDEYDEPIVEVVRLQGSAVFVTDETLASARAVLAAETTRAQGEGRELANPYQIERDVEMGDLLAVIRDGDANRPMSRHAIGLTNQMVVTLNIGGEPREFPLNHLGLLEVREAIYAKMEAGEALEPIDRNVLDGVSHILEAVANEPDPERFPPSLTAVAFQAGITDTYRNAELPVPAEDMARKVRSDVLRALIGRVDPAHPQALTAGRGLQDFLEAAAIRSPDNLGAEVRPRSYDDPRLRSMIRTNDRMCREVFGALTQTPIERLGVAMCPKADIDRMIAMAGDDQKLTGPWVDEANARLARVTRAAMAGYRFEAAFLSQGGTDLLAVKDQMGGYLYSWPTAERQPQLAIGQGLVATISPQEVPTVEEIEALEQVYERVVNNQYAQAMLADDEGPMLLEEPARDEADDMLDEINNLPELRPNRLH